MSNRQTVIALALGIAFVGQVLADNPRGWSKVVGDDQGRYSEL